MGVVKQRIKWYVHLCMKKTSTYLGKWPPLQTPLQSAVMPCAAIVAVCAGVAVGLQ